MAYSGQTYNLPQILVRVLGEGELDACLSKNYSEVKSQTPVPLYVAYRLYTKGGGDQPPTPPQPGSVTVKRSLLIIW